MPTSEAGLTFKRLIIPESIPEDISFLDAYQENTWSQVQRDENGRTIKGKTVLQYMANMLRLLNKRLSEVLKVGLLARELDIASSTRADETFRQEIERTIPAFFLIGSAGELATSARELRDNPRSDGRLARESAVVIASGKFMLSAFHVASSRFGSTYESFLNLNKEKLAKRIAQGTIFDKSGGDDR